jgi:coronin-1B/1C/6
MTDKVHKAESAQAFIWKVPEGFTLYTDAEEVTDVAPVSKLAGHSRCAL